MDLNIEQIKLRENNPYSEGYIFLFEEGDYLLLRDELTFQKSPNDRYYTVEQEDTLWTIADKAYGNSKWWWIIRDANLIDWGMIIIPGTTLFIPDLQISKLNFS